MDPAAVECQMGLKIPPPSSIPISMLFSSQPPVLNLHCSIQVICHGSKWVGKYLPSADKHVEAFLKTTNILTNSRKQTI
jgi:hypothetical protein